MKRLMLLSILMAGSLSAQAQSGYRFGSRFIGLEVDDTMYFIQAKDAATAEKRASAMVGSIREEKIRDFVRISEKGFLIVSDSIPANATDYFSNVYRDAGGNRIMVLPRIVLMLEEGRAMESVMKKFGKTLSVESRDGLKYVLGCRLDNSEEVLELTREIDGIDGIEWCEPEMLSEIRLFNTLYPQQYYLKNTGQNGGTVGMDINVEPVWDITDGSSDIVVAVIDDGVDMDHEDMGNRVLQGYTIGNPAGYGVPQNADNTQDGCKAHGMACAGIVAASNNAIGVRGGGKQRKNSSCQHCPKSGDVLSGNGS